MRNQRRTVTRTPALCALGALVLAACGDDGRSVGVQTAMLQQNPISLAASLKLDAGIGSHGPVAVYKKLAILGTDTNGCPGRGVDIVDLTNPLSPVKLSDTTHIVDSSSESLKAMRIGDRDVLAVPLLACNRDQDPATGRRGLELVDITDPAHPVDLSFFESPFTGTNPNNAPGVDRVDLTRGPGGKVLALLAAQNLETTTANSAGLGGKGDLLILDITDPTAPALIGEWGIQDEPALGPAFAQRVRQGTSAQTRGREVRANADGTLAYLAYWDAGTIVLDISDPTAPRFIGHTRFAPTDEGNAARVADAQDGRILLQGNSDAQPFHISVTSSAFAGERSASEAVFTPKIGGLPGNSIAGEVVFVGFGCPATPTRAADPYLADPAGKIALVERGNGCAFDDKIARAQVAGATAVIVFNNLAGGEAILTMNGRNPYPGTFPGDVPLVIDVPAIFVARSTGLALATGAPPVTVKVDAIFDGWGDLWTFDIDDPAHPVKVGTYASPGSAVQLPDTIDPTVLYGIVRFTVQGDTVYSAWNNDGVRIVDIEHPERPREKAFWVGEGKPADAPRVSIQDVVRYDDRTLLAVDRTYGLYVLQYRE